MPACQAQTACCAAACAEAMPVVPMAPDAGRRRALLAGLMAMLVVPAVAQNAGAEGAVPPPAAPSPELPLPTLGSALVVPDVVLLDGSRWVAADFDARVLVVYWWASWCPFCAVQSPLIERLWRQHRAQGLQVLGLSIDRKAEDATRYLAQRGYSFPSAMVTPAISRVLPKPKGLPVTVVRGRDGRVHAAEAGQLFPEDIEQYARFL